jgi:hypothetical protein
MHTMSTLLDSLSVRLNVKLDICDVPFNIICRVCKEPREESFPASIATENNKTVGVSVCKVLAAQK